MGLGLCRACHCNCISYRIALHRTKNTRTFDFAFNYSDSAFHDILVQFCVQVSPPPPSSMPCHPSPHLAPSYVLTYRSAPLTLHYTLTLTLIPEFSEFSLCPSRAHTLFNTNRYFHCFVSLILICVLLLFLPFSHLNFFFGRLAACGFAFSAV